MQLRILVRGILVCLIVLGGLSSNGISQQRKRTNVQTATRPGKQRIQSAGLLTPDIQSALDQISPDSLRGHLSFIASDLLEGRSTPSRGLDLAAEYIAAQFRRCGLEPLGGTEAGAGQSYFQIANWLVTEPNLDAFELIVNDGPQAIKIDADQVSFATEQPLDVKSSPIVKVDYLDASSPISKFTKDQIAGKVVITNFPNRTENSRALNEFINGLRDLTPALMISIDRDHRTGTGLGGGRLIDPEGGDSIEAAPEPRFMTIHDPRVIKLFDSMQAGESKGSLSLKIGAVRQRPVKLRNVVGLVRGSDPVLKETYVILSAHYDHIGVNPTAGEDRIFNGANDDGSGAVSVIEIASALAALKERPKRSLVFITWFGEEEGLLGSRYYGRHPVFPLEKTAAMINLEQVGRTDSDEGPQLNKASMTGFDFTDIGPIFKAAGNQTGIEVYKHEQNSDAFFDRSDNQALADAGIPAHTLCVAFEFPDYHQPTDHWEKINYPNMAKVDRMIGLALIMIANSNEAPKWNESNPKTAPYLKAWRSLHQTH